MALGFPRRGAGRQEREVESGERAAARRVPRAAEPGEQAGGACGVGGSLGTVAPGGRRAGGERVVR